MKKKEITVSLTPSEYHAVTRALALAETFYIDRRKLPNVGEWTRVERAAAATDVALAREKFPELPE